MNKYYFTSESVTEGHPDKICDGISDYILDEALRQDRNSKMAVEATIKDELILVYGEAKTNAKLDYELLAKEVLKNIGYEEDYHVIVKVGEKELQIINIHGAWSVDKKGNARTKLQTKAILKRVRHDIPSIVVGDVNLLPDTKEIKKLSKKQK